MEDVLRACREILEGTVDPETVDVPSHPHQPDEVHVETRSCVDLDAVGYPGFRNWVIGVECIRNSGMKDKPWFTFHSWHKFAAPESLDELIDVLRQELAQCTHVSTMTSRAIVKTSGTAKTVHIPDHGDPPPGQRHTQHGQLGPLRDERRQH